MEVPDDIVLIPIPAVLYIGLEISCDLTSTRKERPRAWCNDGYALQPFPAQWPAQMFSYSPQVGRYLSPRTALHLSTPDCYMLCTCNANRTQARDPGTIVLVPALHREVGLISASRRSLYGKMCLVGTCRGALHGQIRLISTGAGTLHREVGLIRAG